MTASTALRRAIEDEEVLTPDQFRELIAIEADEIGLTFDQAVELAKRGTLPNNSIGQDIRMLVSMLSE